MKAVLISDIHFNISTLPLASVALKQAVNHANNLNLPLVIAGDLHDTKANLRGECVNAMIDIIAKCSIKPYVLVGNHDKINEKSEEHSLNFLSPYAHIIERPIKTNFDVYLIPYYSDVNQLKEFLQTIELGSVLVMHQGVSDSNSGEYYQDRTALPKECFEDFRVISGHYHARQDIKCGTGGLFSYIGNPYTLTFGEADDPTKGFQVLNGDGSLTHIPTNLRRHHKFQLNVNELAPLPNIGPEDLVWVQLKGSKSELLALSRDNIKEILQLPTSAFRLELVYNDIQQESLKTKVDSIEELIENTIINSEQQKRLKELWKRIGS